MFTVFKVDLSSNELNVSGAECRLACLD